jgi:hypothetical protein
MSVSRFSEKDPVRECPTLSVVSCMMYRKGRFSCRINRYMLCRTPTGYFCMLYRFFLLLEGHIICMWDAHVRRARAGGGRGPESCDRRNNRYTGTAPANYLVKLKKTCTGWLCRSQWPSRSIRDRCGLLVRQNRCRPAIGGAR